MFSDNEDEDIQYEDLAHKNALIVEFMAANKDGNGQRYLKFIKDSAKKFKDKDFANYFIRENILASKKAVEIIESRKLR
jgi:CRISPR/Cas system CSM-associated protein Csm5 (group 7 of RAMP superfamily)